MPEGVAEVEDLAQRRLAKVLGDDPRLDRDRPLDELPEHRGRRVRRGVHRRLDEVEDRRVGDEPALDDLGEPGEQSWRGRVSSAARSQSTPAGGWKAPTRFLPSAVLMPVLPPTAASTMAEQRRRHLDDADAAQPRRRDEPGEVGDRSPADADDGVRPGEARLPEHLPAEGEDRRRSSPPRRPAPPRRSPRSPARRGPPGPPRRSRAGRGGGRRAPAARRRAAAAAPRAGRVPTTHVVALARRPGPAECGSPCVGPAALGRRFAWPCVFARSVAHAEAPARAHPVGDLLRRQVVGADGDVATRS